MEKKYFLWQQNQEHIHFLLSKLGLTRINCTCSRGSCIFHARVRQKATRQQILPRWLFILSQSASILYETLNHFSEISVMTLQLTSQSSAKILRITKRQDGDQCELLAKYYTLINPDARKKHFLPLCLVKQIGNHVAKNFLSQILQYNKFTSWYAN